MYRVIYQQQEPTDPIWAMCRRFRFYYSTAYSSKSYLKKLINNPSPWGTYNFRHTHRYSCVTNEQTILKVVKDVVRR